MLVYRAYTWLQAGGRGVKLGRGELRAANRTLEALRSIDEPGELTAYLQNLGGSAILAVEGRVYTPKYTRAFGDFLIMEASTITAVEEVKTRANVWRKGSLAYLLKGAAVVCERVRVDAEEYCEDGPPRFFFADEADFRIQEFYLETLDGDRERRYLEGQARAGLLINHTENL